MKKIFLKNQDNVCVLVDNQDFDSLNAYTWYLGSSGYAVRYFVIPGTKSKDRRRGKYKFILMHRQLLDLFDVKGVLVDHKNMNKLDNQRSNLRACSIKESNWHRSKQRPSTSKFKGVKRAKSGSWVALIKGSYIGTFKSEKEAAREYNKRAITLYGEFAYLNNV